MPLDSTKEITASVGKLEVLQNGILHSTKGTEVSFKISTLTFVFRFLSDDGVSRYTGTIEDEVLYINLYNHKNPLGEGQLVPFEVALLDGKSLSVSYYLHTVGGPNESRRLEYVIYSSEVAV